MKIKISDKSLFGSEIAEDETDDVFISYAVSRQEVVEFLNIDNPIAIVRAYKGDGKSALLRLVKMGLTASTDPSLTIHISAHSVSPDIESNDSDKWIRGWKANLLSLAAREIGANISRAFSDDAIALVEEAESNGFKSRSFFSAIADRLSSKAVPLEIKRIGASNPEELLKRWCTGKSYIWFLIDDVDQNFENTAKYKAKIAAFFTALRHISIQIPEFRFRATIRPNVWSIIKREYEALSHVEQYIHDIRWSQTDFYELIAKRIEGYLRRNNQWDEAAKNLPKKPYERNQHLIALVFEDPMPWGPERTRPPGVVLYTLARHRPRWLVELWKVSANAATKIGRGKISLQEINNELASFGQRRIDDAIAEFRSQCPEVGELIIAFSGQPERFKTSDLITILKNRVLQAVTPNIVGVLGTPTATDVAHFLFQIGFLTARRDLENGDYEHIAYAENPMLLAARTNLDQGYAWEVHPVFRHPLRLKNYTGKD